MQVIGLLPMVLIVLFVLNCVAAWVIYWALQDSSQITRERLWGIWDSLKARVFGL